MSYRIGVDIGGSFTDFAALNASGEVVALKVFSRPDQPGAEVIEGIRQLESRYGITSDQISYFTHGTTVGINTVIQRKGLKLCLLATEGFIDVLELARLKTTNMYDLVAGRPEPLIPRDRAYPVRERMDADGNVLTALDVNSVERAAAAAVEQGCQGIVVSLLHSYRNPAHEQQVKKVLERVAPDVPVFLSSEVWPIVREYERTITAAVSGYVQPRVTHYLTSLQSALKAVGVAPEPRITKSNGGVMSAEQGKSECIQMILSGTASGVIGAAFAAEAAGISKAMSLDIGGTSADVALILNGQPQYGSGEVIGDFSIFIPSVSVSSIGEGGGSIAWVDEFGVLKVGPESAGSSPGPACYGRGGTRPTVTDAFAVCGFLSAGELGYNAVRVDVDKSRAAIQPLAERLGQSVEATAEAIQSICISGMYAGVSALVSRFGIDPREFSLIAFGGAGPMLAAMLGREFGMREVVVPLTPGVLSALGGLVADIKSDFIKTTYWTLGSDILAPLKSEFQLLRDEGTAWVRAQQGQECTVQHFHSADMRYAGQSYEVEVPLQESWIEHGELEILADAFHARHKALFGHADPSAAVQVVNLRLVASAPTPKPRLQTIPLRDSALERSGTVKVWLEGASQDVPWFTRKQLGAEDSFHGPAVVAQDDCTTIIPARTTVKVDSIGNLRISFQY